MLHIINKADLLNSCLRVAQSDDAILLIEDGVLAAIQSLKLKTYALESDLIARGLLTSIAPEVQIIDYAGFVDLTVQYHPIQSWS